MENYKTISPIWLQSLKRASNYRVLTGKNFAVWIEGFDDTLLTQNICKLPTLVVTCHFCQADQHPATNQNCCLILFHQHTNIWLRRLHSSYCVQYPTTTTLVKTLGTLMQQLVKLRHLPSPLPPQCNVEVMHSSFNSTQSTLLGGDGDSRNSLL